MSAGMPLIHIAAYELQPTCTEFAGRTALKHDTFCSSHIFPALRETNAIGYVGFDIIQKCDAPARPVQWHSCKLAEMRSSRLPGGAKGIRTSALRGAGADAALTAPPLLSWRALV